MSVKSTVITATTVIALGLGATTVLTPRTASEQLSDSADQGSTAVEKQQEELKKREGAAAETERLQKLRPSEYRPKLPGVRIWWP